MSSSKKSQDGGSPFAALAGLREQLPPGPERTEPPPQEDPPARRGPARAVVRLERKGRRGKEATRIEKLGLDAAELAVWCRDLKKALGCGGTVEDADLLLQGDVRERVSPLLSARGVRKVTVS